MFVLWLYSDSVYDDALIYYYFKNCFSVSELDTVASDIRMALKACQNELKQVNEQKKTTEKECLIYRKQIVVSTCTCNIIILLYMYYYTVCTCNTLYYVFTCNIVCNWCMCMYCTCT